MNFSRFIASRYLKARRKQAFIGVISIITLLGITLGVAALNVALAIHNGMHAAFVQSLVGETGSLYITANSLKANGFDMDEVEQIASVLADTPGVSNYALTLTEGGVAVSRRKRLQYVRLTGIMPEQFLKTSDMLDNFEQGGLIGMRPQGEPPFAIALGADLASSLGVAVGDEIKIAIPRISSPGITRQGFKFREMKCVVTGTFRTGSSQFDERDAYLHINSLFLLMNTTKVRSVLTRFDSLEAMDHAKPRLAANPKLPMSATVIDFRDLNSSLLSALKLEKLATTVVITLFIMIVALNMISALTMLVMEKHRDIGIMKSFGASNKDILRIFIRQGMTLALWGTVFGTTIGVSLSYVADHFQLIKLDNAVYEVLNYLPFKLDIKEVAGVFVFSLVLSFLTTIFPARQAANLNPVEALKYD